MLGSAASGSTWEWIWHWDWTLVAGSRSSTTVASCRLDMLAWCRSASWLSSSTLECWRGEWILLLAAEAAGKLMPLKLMAGAGITGRLVLVGVVAGP